MRSDFKFPWLMPRYWLTWMGTAVLRLLVLLPFPVQISLGKSLGWGLYHLARSRRHVVETNLRLSFPELSEEERNQRVKNVFSHNGVGVLETAMAWWSNEAVFDQRVRISGREHLQQALDNGEGVILVSAHFTPLDLGVYLLSRSFAVDAVYRQHNNPLFDHVIRQGRLRFMSQVIERSNLRQMVRRLKQGKFIWYAPDQDHGPTTSIYVPFFGTSAATVTSTARLAKMSGAKVVMFSFRRSESDDYYQLDISEPLDNFPTQDAEQDALRINQLLEDEIRKAPDQYMWVHKRFKTHPKGKNFVYR